VDVDVIVVDNASTDGSLEVAQALASDDARIRVIGHQTNLGHIVSFNEGAHAATGEYVVLLCADDLLAPGSLARATALMEAHRNVAFTYGFARTFSDRPPPVQKGVAGWSIWSGAQWIRRRYQSGRNVIANPEVVMRREVMDKLDYDPRLPHTADLLVWMRAALRGDVGRIVGPCQAYYRVHGANLHLSDRDGLLRDLRARRKAFELVAEDGAGHPSRPDELLVRARRALARESLALACRSYDRSEAVHGAAARDYVAFALETYPKIRRSPHWAAYEFRATGRMPRWWQWGARQTNEFRHRLLWQKWRWYGA